MSINHHDPVWALKLQYVQANILKHHGRDNAWHIFLSFDAGQQENTKKLLQDYALKLTSAARQLADVDLRKIHKNHDGGIVRCMFLSKAGYDTLGLKKDVWAGNTDDNAFKNGMRASQSTLNDPEVKDWETYYQKILHGMILIADDELSVLQKELNDIRADFNNVITIVHVQKGEVLRNPEGIGIEHFGYVDGISQPEFLVSAQHHGKVYSDAADEKLVLVKDPGVSKTGTILDDACMGSFFVFRKLEQNVKQFKADEKSMGHDLYPNNEEIAGAFVVGRFESSSPVVKHEKEEKIDSENKIDNDFDYSTDVAGSKCPYHAHIRIVNPRTTPIDKMVEALGSDYKPSNPIARRGIPYDEAGRNGNLSWYPEGDVGLLFMAYQSSLENGFEAMQKAANLGDGVIGQNIPSANQNWPEDYGDLNRVNHPFASSVKLKGGEYFFAPSLFFLHNLTSL